MQISKILWKINHLNAFPSESFCWNCNKNDWFLKRTARALSLSVKSVIENKHVLFLIDSFKGTIQWSAYGMGQSECYRLPSQGQTSNHFKIPIGIFRIWQVCSITSYVKHVHGFHINLCFGWYEIILKERDSNI